MEIILKQILDAEKESSESINRERLYCRSQIEKLREDLDRKKPLEKKGIIEKIRKKKDENIAARKRETEDSFKKITSLKADLINEKMVCKEIRMKIISIITEE